MTSTHTDIPLEALVALKHIKESLGGSVAAVYLYGSAVAGGLRNNSDVDIMVVVNQRPSEATLKDLAERLLRVSGRMGDNAVRPLEVTVINHDDVVPWKYPPRKEFIYGEWLRGSYEQGQILEPADDPDLAIILSQLLQHSVPLMGKAASELLDPVPMADVRTAMRESLPGLIACTKGDERNVILTLARMWVTAVTGAFLPKDEAAQCAMRRLPEQQAALLDLAGRAYRGECVDTWGDKSSEVSMLVQHLEKEIEHCLNRN